MSNEQRSTWVDLARGFGIILVVYGHVAVGFCSAGLECPQPYESVIRSTIYSFHMPLFFFISGLFMMKSMESQGGAKELVISKVRTLLYPYALWSVLQGAIEIQAAQFKSNAAPTWLDILSFPWIARMQFWFLHALFCIFVVSAVALTLVPKRHHPWLLVFSLFMREVIGDLTDIIIIIEFVRYMPFFMAGVVLRQMIFSGQLNKTWVAVSLVLLACLLEFVFYDTLGQRGETSVHWMRFPLAMVCILAVVSTCQQLQSPNLNWLVYIGASSMAIYVMHAMIIVAVRIVLAKFAHVDDFVIHIIAGTLVGVLLPLIIMRLGGPKMNLLFVAPAWRKPAVSRQVG